MSEFGLEWMYLYKINPLVLNYITMSEKNRKNLRATHRMEYPEWVAKREPRLFPTISRKFRGHNVRFKNKKHTLGRLKRATHLNNRNNIPLICPRGTKTPEEYALYMKYKNA